MDATTPSRFGPFVLLKQLSEDALGETYRAGEVVDGAMRSILLLRIFNGQNIDQNALADVKDASPYSQQAPGLLPTHACGTVEGLPYIAYDYLQGQGLPALIRTARQGFSTFETQHAVLIISRIAKGLGQVHEIGGVHGLVVPPLILVSNEGEAKLLGFEYGNRLASMAQEGALGEALASYLSPEVRGGQTSTSRDDVYSLGAVLWELLTGNPPPQDVQNELETRLSMASLVGEGTSLPDGLAALLKRSLAPAAERFRDAEAWHRGLRAWIKESEFKGTNFNLAFLMHELFRQEIQREDDQIAEEKRLDLDLNQTPTAAIVPTPEPPPSAAPPAEPPAREAMPPAGVAVAVAEESGSRRGWLIGVAALLVVLLVSAYFLVPWQGSASDAQTTSAAAQPAPPVVPPPAVVDPAPAAADTTTEPAPPPPPAIDMEAATEELERLMAERAEAMEERLTAEYEARIASLQEQLETANAEKRAAPPPPPAPAPPPPVVRTPPPPVVAAPPPPVVPPPTVAPPPPRKPVVVPPRLVSMPEPKFPKKSKTRGAEAVVKVEVLVGTDGRVRQARLPGNRAPAFAFDSSALESARQAVFKPGTTDGKPTETWTDLEIRFKRDQ